MRRIHYFEAVQPTATGAQPTAPRRRVRTPLAIPRDSRIPCASSHVISYNNIVGPTPTRRPHGSSTSGVSRAVPHRTAAIRLCAHMSGFGYPADTHRLPDGRIRTAGYGSRSSIKDGFIPPLPSVSDPRWCVEVESCPQHYSVLALVTISTIMRGYI